MLERKENMTNHITLTGNLGSGKSTICKIMDEKYSYEIYSTGKVQRSIAAEMGITVLEMNQLMCEDPRYDHLIDDATAKISKDNLEKKIVFDSRLAWHFVDCSFKIFLSVNIDEAARRVYADTKRGEVEKYKSEAEARELLIKRANTEDKRYRDIYGLEYFDFTNYNLILDSSHAAPELLAGIMKHENDIFDEKAPGKTRILVSPFELLNKKDDNKKGTYATAEAGLASVDAGKYYPEGNIGVRYENGKFELAGPSDGKAVDMLNMAVENGFQFVLCYLA